MTSNFSQYTLTCPTCKMQKVVEEHLLSENKNLYCEKCRSAFEISFNAPAKTSELPKAASETKQEWMLNQLFVKLLERLEAAPQRVVQSEFDGAGNLVSQQLLRSGHRNIATMLTNERNAQLLLEIAEEIVAATAKDAVAKVESWIMQNLHQPYLFFRDSSEVYNISICICSLFGYDGNRSTINLNREQLEQAILKRMNLR